MMVSYSDDGEDFKPNDETPAEFNSGAAAESRDTAEDIDVDGLRKALASRKTPPGRYKAVEKWAAKERAKDWHSEDITLEAVPIAEEFELQQSRVEEACHRGYELDLKRRTEAAEKDRNERLAQPIGTPTREVQDAEVKRLAQLKKKDFPEYTRVKRAEAKKLGKSLRELEDLIKHENDRAVVEDTEQLYPHWAVEPWPEPVSTADLINEIAKLIPRYVATLADRVYVIAAWILFTWVHHVAVHSPILGVTSPDANSGKSTLLGLLAFLVRKAFASVEITGPALFRSLELWTPTFVLDECDTAFVNNDDLRSVINSGWTRGQGVVRCDPETNVPHLFPTFAPKVIGLKGSLSKQLPDTTASRTVDIKLKRKLPAETVEDFDHIDNPELATLRRKLARWADDFAETLRTIKPEPIPGFHNRRRANWKILLAIAGLAGADIDTKVRAAARVIEGIDDKNTADASIGAKLLCDIRDLFNAQASNDPDFGRLKSQAIVDALAEIEGRPWAEWRDKKPMTKTALSVQLEPYGIAPTKMHFTNEKRSLNGYQLFQFEEAFERYLGTASSEQKRPEERENAEEGVSNRKAGINPTATATSSIFQTGRQNDAFQFEKAKKSNNDGRYSVLPVSTPPPVRSHHNGHSEQHSDGEGIPAFLRVTSADICIQCGFGNERAAVFDVGISTGETVKLHRACMDAYHAALPSPPPGNGHVGRSP